MVLQRALRSSVVRGPVRRTLAVANGASAFRAKLASRARGVSIQFAVIPSPVATQAMGAAGADAVCVDLEHGPIDFEAAHAMCAAVRGTGAASLIRVPSIEPLAAKRALDVGADGLLFPLAETADDVERAVACTRYPPEGVRGFGPFAASSAQGFGFGDAAAHYAKHPPLVVVLIETVAAVENVEAILDVPGVDVFQLAQFDLSTALGASGDFDAPAFRAAERKVEEAALSRDVTLGAVALTRERAAELHRRGYRATVGFDLHWLKAAVSDAQSWVD